MSSLRRSRLVNQQEEPKTISKILEFMEKDLPSKFASLTGEKVASAEPKLEKREKPDTKEADKKQISQHNAQTELKDEGNEEKGERVKPRPNLKPKRVKESTDEKGEDAQTEPADGAEKPKRDPSKTRCNFWPSCKNKDCPFVHPNQQVG